MESQLPENILTRHAARNFWLNVLDGGMFMFGLSLVSRFTVLPLFIERLSGAAWMQGLIPAINYTGWFLPGLFVVPLIASLPRRKPYILAITIGERLPWLLLGLVLLLAPGLPSAALLAIFFLLYGVQTFSGGLTMTAWQDFIARLIPGRRWGFFFGIQSSFGGLLGVGGALIASAVLATQPFPQSVGILSLICFVAMVFSYIFLASTVEPPQEVEPRQPFYAFLGGILPLLRRDHAFRRYLFCRTTIALGLTGHSFLTAAALERFQLPDAEIGIFTAALLAAQAVSDLGLGALADRWGHKQVLELSTIIGVLALLAAAVAPSPDWFVPIFVLVGVSQAGYSLSGFTLVFAFSNPAERPTYIGVASTAVAPVAAFGPLLAGALASAAGYTALFVVLLFVGLAGLAALHWRVAAPARIEAAPHRE